MTFARCRPTRAYCAMAVVLAVLTAFLFTLGSGQRARAAAALTQVSAFGSNPGALQMFDYVPASPSSNASLVVALHGCTQQAADYYRGNGGAAPVIQMVQYMQAHYSIDAPRIYITDLSAGCGMTADLLADYFGSVSVRNAVSNSVIDRAVLHREQLPADRRRPCRSVRRPHLCRRLQPEHR